MKKVTIVYYAFINPDIAWWNIIGGQLTQLIGTGILSISELYIHISSSNTLLQDECIQKIKILIPDSKIFTSTINRFEYDGIYLLWKLGIENPKNIYLYFHSKGMSHGNDRMLQERKLFQEVIVPYSRILSIFHDNSDIHKIGFTASESGWMWFNFWWATGTYLADCEEPVLTHVRHYYEDWLHRKLKGSPLSSPAECYSLADNKLGIFYEPEEACRKIDSIQLR